MKISKKWLQEYVDVSDLTVEELASKVTKAGVEIESIEYLSKGTNLIIGEVLEKSAHPDSDHLNVCKVNLGKEVVQIVCGASNVDAHQKVIVALPGAILPAKGLTIQKGTIRGQESNGMICSLSELGVSEKYLEESSKIGIEVLPSDAIVGYSNPLEYLGLDDVLLELKPTPDRGDVYSLYSFALEVGAVLNRKVKPLQFKTTKATKKALLTSNSSTPKCQLFAIKGVHGLKIKPSPLWLKRKLMGSGIRSINNVVDIGNYVMVLTGQPLHMYDRNKLSSNEFNVQDNLTLSFQALDHSYYHLSGEDLFVTNHGQPVCLAGVMGSLSTSVDSQTTSLAIEGAIFDGVSIRKTAKKTLLFSDAATRYIRGVDKERTVAAVELAATLLVELADAQEIEETYVYDKMNHEPIKININVTQVNHLLGTQLTTHEISDVFSRLNFSFEHSNEEYIVTAPSYRNDLTIKEDLIEEVIRILGFDCLQTSLPQAVTSGGLSYVQHKRRLVREQLSANGLLETLNYTLDDPKYDHLFDVFSLGEHTPLMMPMSEERWHLRKSLIPTLLHTVAYNLNRSNKDLALYELSNVYQGGNQYERLAITLSGKFRNTTWKSSTNVDFYTIKGLIEGVMRLLGIESTRYSYLPVEKDHPYYHPGRSAYIMVGKKILGVLGQIHPNMEKVFDVGECVVGEIDFDGLLQMKSGYVKFAAPSLYPSTSRDIALVVKKEIASADLLKVIKKTGKALVSQVEVFDIYEGDHVEEGFKSIAISIVYADLKKTLKEEDVAPTHQSILMALETSYGAVLRK